MAAGELTQIEHQPSETTPVSSLPAAPSDLAYGSVVTASGRISAAANVFAQPPPSSPFSPEEVARLDDALTWVTRYTQLRFSIYLGDLGGPARPAAERLHERLGAAATDSVLIAVDPEHRSVAIVTGPEARVRLSDRACHLAVMSMVASFSEGDLLGGLLSGLRMLSDQAGQPQVGQSQVSQSH